MFDMPMTNLMVHFFLWQSLTAYLEWMGLFGFLAKGLLSIADGWVNS